MGIFSHHQALLRRAYQSQIQLELSNTVNIATPVSQYELSCCAALQEALQHWTDRTFSRLKQQILLQT